MTPDLAIVVVSFNTRDLLDDCLASVHEQTRGVSFETIVVDNASRDGSAAMVRKKYPATILVESGENLGFGRANNLGFSHSRAATLMPLNSDAVLLEDTGTALHHYLQQHPRVGIVGPKVILPDGTRQAKTCGMLPSARVMANQNLLLGRLFPRSRFFAGLFVESFPAREFRIGWVSGVCLALRRAVYARTGGFDPSIFMYAEDIDLCARAAAFGWETWRVEDFAVRHLGGGSTRSADDMLRLRILQQRNLLRLTDATMGPAARALTRASLAAGLVARTAVRGVAAAGRGGESRRQAWRADWRCLTDFLAAEPRQPTESHAHRT